MDLASKETLSNPADLVGVLVGGDRLHPGHAVGLREASCRLHSIPGLPHAEHCTIRLFADEAASLAWLGECQRQNDNASVPVHA